MWSRMYLDYNKVVYLSRSFIIMLPLTKFLVGIPYARFIWDFTCINIVKLMTFRMLQMALRSSILFLMLVAISFHWECKRLATPSAFFISGVYGAYIVITMGLLMEISFGRRSNLFIEASLLVGAIVLNVACAVLSFWEIDSCGHKTTVVNKIFVSIFVSLLYMADLVFVCCFNR